MTDYSLLWDKDTPVRGYDIEVPAWIDQDISTATVVTIYEGGCASGAYMPAVHYVTAREAMHEHGDDVLEFIEDHLGELPQLKAGKSWSGLAVAYLSMAVELWASSIIDELVEAVEAAEAEEDEEE